MIHQIDGGFHHRQGESTQPPSQHTIVFLLHPLRLDSVGHTRPGLGLRHTPNDGFLLCFQGG